MISVFETAIPAAPPRLKEVNKICEKGKGEIVKVKKDYFSKGLSEMSVFTDDEYLELIDDSDAHWYLLRDRRSGLMGYVPAALVISEDALLATMNAFHNMNISAEPLAESREKLAKTMDKKVSFSDEEPEMYLVEKIEYEDEVWSPDQMNTVEDDGDPEVGDYMKGSTFLQDALIDEAVRKALGIDDAPKIDSNASFVHVHKALRAEEERMLPSDDYISSEERVEIPESKAGKVSFFTKMLYPLMKSQGKAKDNNVPGMVKVFTGNFTAIPSYKTCMLEESATMLELENVAKKLYRIDELDDDYEVTLVHNESAHVLPVQSSFSLGTLTEIAKVATIEDGLLPDAKGKPVGRHRKKVTRAHLLLIRKRKQNVSIKGIKTGFYSDPRLIRHKASDFPTNYRFVLNMKVAPYIRNQFYIWVEIESAKEEEQCASRIALAVKALTTVEEIIDRSLRAMDIGQMAGVSYDLLLDIKPSHIHQYRFEGHDGREILSREMTINDVRNQWSHIDSSGFLFLLKPFVNIGSEPSTD